MNIEFASKTKNFSTKRKTDKGTKFVRDDITIDPLTLAPLFCVDSQESKGFYKKISKHKISK